MKRFLSLVLSLAMILPIMLAATPALAEENPYAEHLTFKVFTIDGSDDMFNWPLVKQAMEKFNFDFEIQLVAWDSWDESTRTLAYTQSLPEVIAWYNLNKDEYLEWVEEGVFKALPDDMSAYPNLEKLINSYTCFDQFRVDGKLYTFPKIKNSNPVNLYTTYMFAYRRDWAKAMGYDWAPVQTLTYDEFVAYLRDVKEKDPGHMGDKLVPLDLDNGGKHWAMLAQLWNQRIGSFDIVDGQYCWSAEDPSSLEAIKQERRWELAFESIRWWDILRWSGPSLEEAGDILNKQTGFNIINAATVVPMVKFDYKKRLQATQGYWPIPQDEIDISNGVLEQNPGWDASAQFSDWNNM